jgi:RND family efflux transporter MFP subunit
MRSLRYLLPVLLIAGAAFWFWRADSPLIKTAAVRREAALDAVPAVVNVRPEFQLTLTSTVAGRVLTSALKPGLTVEKDDLLFELDPSLYQIELKRLTAQLANLRSQYALDFEQTSTLARQQEDLANFERLLKEGNYPEVELRRRREEFRILSEKQEKDRLARQQQLSELEFSISQQKRFITDCAVRAPAAGTVTEVFFHPGELVSLGASLVTFYSRSLLVEARVNEEDFSGIRPGLDASVRFLAYGTEQYAARLTSVLPNADAKTQQYRALLSVEIDPARLIPGLSGEASIIRNRRADTLVVPLAAVYNGVVFVIEGDTARRVTVETGFRGSNVVEVTGGLSTGQQVALSHVETLRDGQRVRLAR